jgi:hypothetical protein
VIKEASNALESSKSTLDNALPALDFLMEQFEAGKAAHQGDTLLATCFNSGWSKLDKYYSMTEDTPAYSAAVCLHPSYKLSYFTSNWSDHPEWIDSAEQQVRSLWECMYIFTLIRSFN